MTRISEIACATFGVRDVRATSAFYRDVFNYEQLATGEVDPGLAKTHFFLGTALKQSGRYDEALGHLGKATARVL